MGTKKKVPRRSGSYPVEFRLQLVKLHLEEGYSIAMLAEEFGCGKSTISKWLGLYKQHGEAGLSHPATKMACRKGWKREHKFTSHPNFSL